MIKPLHPTLKACKCGKICSRTQLYKHFEVRKLIPNFFTLHGEVPLNADDPRLDLTTQLELSLSRQELIDAL